LTNSVVIVKIVALNGYSTSKDQIFQAAGKNAMIRCVSWINLFDDKEVNEYKITRFFPD